MLGTAKVVDWNGSSPLTRGKRTHGARRGPRSGLIPAHAGKTQRTPLGSPPPEAHPRSRGENRGQRARGLLFLGSSPLTRGKQANEVPNRLDSGLIPAHAGKTAVRRRPGRVRGAHPRSRGENCCASPPWPGAWGSSPLTRGKRRSASRLNLTMGLIPAHAGKTPSGPPPPSSARAHPRSRGENRHL